MGIDSEIHIVLTLSIHLYWNWSKRFELGIVNYRIVLRRLCSPAIISYFNAIMLYLGRFFSLSRTSADLRLSPGNIVELMNR